MTAVQDVQVVCTAPRLYVVDAFLDPQDIAHVLQLAEHPEQLAPGIAVTRSVAGLAFEMPVGRDPVLMRVRERIAALLGFGNDLDASFRFRRYAPGEGHPRHTDAFPANGSELIVTALIGLVAPDQGGETDFPLAEGGPVSVPHRPGRLVLWYNHTPDGRVDQQSAHAGASVGAGEKTTLTAFVYKPTYYAASSFPAEPRPTPTRRALVVHAGRDGAMTRAWQNAAEWLGFAVDLWDARSPDEVPAADVYIPADGSLAVRRVVSSHGTAEGHGAISTRYRRQVNVPLLLARKDFPVHPTTRCLSAEAPALQAAVAQVGGYPLQAWAGTWLTIHDETALAGLVRHARAKRDLLTIRAPLQDVDRQWIAVVEDRCIGPAAGPAGNADLEQLAIRAVRALHSRTGVVEYTQRTDGSLQLLDVQAPGDLALIPSTWWGAYCLAVMETL